MGANMTTTYFTILMKHLEQTQIEVAAAAASELNTRTMRVKEAVYDCHRLLFIRSGKGRLIVLGQKRPLFPGMLVLLLSGTAHRVEVDPGETMHIDWCHFHVGFDNRDIYRTLRLPMVVSTDKVEEVQKIFEKLTTELARNGLTSRLRIKAALLELISSYLDEVPLHAEQKDPSQDLQKIDTILQYIDEHLADNITVEDLARLVYLHPNYFIVFFKSMMGHSPIQYVNHRRMELAKSLLLKQEYSVSDIAAQVGMQIYYFSRMFKAHTGLTPSRYRKQAFGLGSLAASESEEDLGVES